MAQNEIALRYGCNPHQTPARIFMKNGQSLPFRVLNGAPGYINLLDALNSWQLVKELKQVLHLPAAASFKHVSPAGAAVGLPLSDALKQAYAIGDLELSPLATAYARARGADRLASFGDWVALSDVVDLPTAQLLRREVSDGIIAPGYEPEALAILRQKQQGSYTILEIDPTYEPAEVETREVFGMTFEQKRNTSIANIDQLTTIPTKNHILPDEAKRDLLLALTTLKYTQSNSICLTYDGQCIGIGAGQQSRIYCTRIAADKAARWYLQQHPATLGLRWKKGVKRHEQMNGIDLFLRDDFTPVEELQWEQLFETVPQRLTNAEKEAWLRSLNAVSLGSDAYIPFRDTVDYASQYGVSYIVQPGGSRRDEEVIEACDTYGMVLVYNGFRLFHH
jgi:phosphoribosylaminoimidazolecarboxamide formyltransferase / IMP cyclohydrolase